MPANEVVSILNEYLTKCARSCVVRLRDPTFAAGVGKDNTGVFTGFFISPHGHLLTAFHPLKHRIWDTESHASFELDLELDATSRPCGRESAARRIMAEYAPNSCDFKSDWALLKLDYTCDSYLPLATEGQHTELCAPVRAYGFTEDQPDLPGLGAYEGQYARPFPERSQFRVGFINRGVGQSGGPVVDLEKRVVIGVVSGLHHRQELLTADAAIINQDIFADSDMGADLERLAHRWRGLAAEYISERLPEFRLLAVGQSVPRLPDTFYRGREVSKRLESLLAGGGEPAVIIHGARGSGKTSLAIEAVEGLLRNDIVGAVFWYDFDQIKNRAGDQLVPDLALHLMNTEGAFEPLEQFAYEGQSGVTPGAVASLMTALNKGSQALVFENIHYLLRERRQETILLLEKLAQAAIDGGSRVLFTSWDAPTGHLGFPRYPARGFTKAELPTYFEMYGINLAPRESDYIANYADDIVCLEMFVRSPEWRAAVEEGHALPREPERLLSYWVTRYAREHVPPSANSLLLALAVLEQPADLEMLEAVSAAENFRATLELLRTSPPLVMTEEAQNAYSAHLNVRRAILATTDKSAIIRAHERAADFWAGRKDFAAAARHRLRSGDPAGALALIRDNRDSIIAAGKLVDLEALANELLESSRNIPDGPYALHVILASCSNIRGDYAAARRHWTFSLRNPPDGLATAMLFNGRGDSYRLASEYLSAAEDYQRAESLTAANPAAPYREELGKARLGLAKLSRLAGEYDQAREHYMAAQDAFEECFDEKGIVETSFGVGEVTRLLGDWAASRRAYSESLEKARAIGSAEREAYALWGLGEVLRLTGDYASAEDAHRRGLDLCTKVGDTRSEGWALLGLAETYRASAALDSARVAYQQAADRFTGTKSSTEIAHANLGWCEAERADGRIHLDQYEAVERTYRDKRLRHCLLLCLMSKAGALRADGISRKATQCLDEARQLALEIGLARELSEITMMRDDSAAAPVPQLNFP